MSLSSAPKLPHPLPVESRAPSDPELIAMAVFKLQEAAGRLATLAEQVDAKELRTRLAWLSAQLRKQAGSLAARRPA